MLRKLILGTLLPILFTATLTLMLNIQSTEAQITVIYIRADGSIDPPTAPIQRNGNTYTFTGDINGSIVVERDNIILDGNNHFLQGDGTVNGVDCPKVGQFRSNVTIKNVFINNFHYGIYSYNSSGILITNVTVTGCNEGIWLPYGSNVNVTNNIIRNNDDGMEVAYCTGVVARNLITYNGYGLLVMGADVTENRIINNSVAIYTIGGGTWIGNDVINNTKAIWAIQGHMVVFHNNFINNSILADFFETTATWDDGYPSGGNHWSGYNGTDLFRGSNQDISGSDGIGDTQCIIDANNRDNYPLMGQFGFSTPTGLNVTVFPAADVCLTFENVTGAGSTTAEKTEIGPPLPPNSTLIGQYIDIETTAAFAGNVSVRVTYDDSNMTEEEESGLQLLQWLGEPCDVTGPTPSVPDGIVNMRDIGYFCDKYMTTPSSPNWDPRCDVTGPVPGVPDGIVNMRDIGEVCSDFSETGEWVSVTLFVDTENNVIYGETGHFSMFGVTRD